MSYIHRDHKDCELTWVSPFVKAVGSVVLAGKWAHSDEWKALARLDATIEKITLPHVGKVMTTKRVARAADWGLRAAWGL